MGFCKVIDEEIPSSFGTKHRSRDHFRHTWLMA